MEGGIELRKLERKLCQSALLTLVFGSIGLWFSNHPFGSIITIRCGVLLGITWLILFARRWWHAKTEIIEEFQVLIIAEFMALLIITSLFWGVVNYAPFRGQLPKGVYMTTLDRDQGEYIVHAGSQLENGRYFLSLKKISVLIVDTGSKDEYYLDVAKDGRAKLYMVSGSTLGRHGDTIIIRR